MTFLPMACLAVCWGLYDRLFHLLHAIMRSCNGHCRLVPAKCEAADARSVLHQPYTGVLHPDLLLCLVGKPCCRTCCARAVCVPLCCVDSCRVHSCYVESCYVESCCVNSCCESHAVSTHAIRVMLCRLELSTLKLHVWRKMIVLFSIAAKGTR